MLRVKMTFLLMCCAWSLYAGDVRNDTVMPGYYIPFDSDFMSCKVKITPAGQPITSVNVQGNKISDSLLRVIAALETGSVVWYDEITKFRDGYLYKIPAYRFVIGHKNSARAVRNPFYQDTLKRAETNAPDTLSAKELGALVLDPHVYRFTITWVNEGAMYRYEVYGNGVYGEARGKIEKLPSGITVVIADIKRKEDDGSETTAPAQIHTVK
jgi:hypothetical protein